MPFQTPNPQRLSLSDIVISQITNPADRQSIKTLVRLTCLSKADISELLLRTMLLMQETGQLTNFPSTFPDNMAINTFNTLATNTLDPSTSHTASALTPNIKGDPVFDPNPITIKPDPDTPVPDPDFTFSPVTTLDNPDIKQEDHMSPFTKPDPAHEENITNLSLLLSSSPHLVARGEFFLALLSHKLGVGPRPAPSSGLEGEGLGDMFAAEEEVVGSLEGIVQGLGRVLGGVEGGLALRRGSRGAQKGMKGEGKGEGMGPGKGEGMGPGKMEGEGWVGGMEDGGAGGYGHGLGLAGGYGAEMGVGMGGWGGVGPMGGPVMGLAAGMGYGIGEGWMCAPGASSEQVWGGGEGDMARITFGAAQY
ncbi:hypothetical protein KVT40_007496 [Elsinoe batatas]|uniref:Uncharacterized protein n=1 Tax=Elsinoe batatas TaxID=2601811 RepID=A0A8K0KX70_9PEZI|nr:hypothetical protein KVT40_007496 [Elsinoe batatas]